MYSVNNCYWLDFAMRYKFVLLSTNTVKSPDCSQFRTEIASKVSEKENYYHNYQILSVFENTSGEERDKNVIKMSNKNV